MRIAIIGPDIIDYCSEYARLVARRATVLLCIARKHQDLDNSLFYPQGLEIDLLDWPRQRQIIRTFAFLIRLKRRLQQWKPDVVHVLVEDNVWMNALVRLIRPIPVITTVHDVIVHPGDSSTSRIPRFLVTLLIKQSQAIVVHGESLANAAAELWPANSRVTFVFPHPPLRQYVRTAKQESLERGETTLFRILFFGRIYKYKGLEYLLRAISVVGSRTTRKVRLIVAGRGDLSGFTELLSALPDVEIHNRFITSQETARLFKEADLLALPYIEASQSGVLMIAMAFGLPVVATNVGELAATIKATGMGLLVPSRDPSALAEALSRIANDAVLKNTLAQNARNALNGEYSEDNLSLRALEMYQTFLANVKESSSHY